MTKEAPCKLCPTCHILLPMKFYAALHRAGAIYMSNRSKLVRRAAVAVLLACVAGCASAPVTFEAPPGTVMFVDGKPYHLPSEVEFSRPADASGSHKYKIRLVFTTPQGEVHAKGLALVFGYAESDIDKLVKNSCKFSDDQLAKLAAGTTMVYKVQTASRQPLLELTLVKE